MLFVVQGGGTDGIELRGRGGGRGGMERGEVDMSAMMLDEGGDFGESNL